MNERTRLSHSVWRSDILKSMGRSLFWIDCGLRNLVCKILGRTVCPPLSRRKRFAGAFLRGWIDISGPSNDSFIQLFRQFPGRGPAMPSDRTRSAILAAAERLYADRGF